jgi:glycosyltransferase involved in cell wall biosynthesis
MLVAKLLRKPLVIDIHGSPTQELLARAPAEAAELTSKERAERQAYAVASVVIVVSAELKVFLKTWFSVPEERLVIVPNGVDISSFQRAVPEDRLRNIKETLHFRKSNKLIVFTCPRVGFLSNEIALIWFLKVIESIESRRKDATCLILGRGKIIPSRSKAVVYAGFVNDLPAVLSISDVCVLPYPPEAICGGVRNKAVEYFAAGRPVVSTSEGMRGIVGGVSGTHYLLADNPQDFADRIIELLSSRSLSRRIGSNGREIAEHYDWQKLAREVYDVLSISAKGTREELKKVQFKSTSPKHKKMIGARYGVDLATHYNQGTKRVSIKAFAAARHNENASNCS